MVEPSQTGVAGNLHVLTNAHLQLANQTSAGSRWRSTIENTIKTERSRAYRLKGLCPIVVGASSGAALRRASAGDIGIIRFLSGSHLVLLDVGDVLGSYSQSRDSRKLKDDYR